MLGTGKTDRRDRQTDTHTDTQNRPSSTTHKHSGQVRGQTHNRQTTDRLVTTGFRQTGRTEEKWRIQGGAYFCSLLFQEEVLVLNVAITNLVSFLSAVYHLFSAEENSWVAGLCFAHCSFRLYLSVLSVLYLSMLASSVAEHVSLSRYTG